MTPGMEAKLARGVAIGALLVALGALVIVLAAGDSLAGVLIVAGILLVIVGVIRLIGMLGVVILDRQRKRLLREGLDGTAVIESVRAMEARGQKIYEMEVRVRAPGVAETEVMKRGSVPPEHIDRLVEGAELPARVDPQNPGLFAIDWARV